jgi:hypothetical protein
VVRRSCSTSSQRLERKPWSASRRATGTSLTRSSPTSRSSTARGRCSRPGAPGPASLYAAPIESRRTRRASLWPGTVHNLRPGCSPGGRPTSPAPLPDWGASPAKGGAQFSTLLLIARSGRRSNPAVAPGHLTTPGAQVQLATVRQVGERYAGL